MKLLRLFIFLILISNTGNSQNSPKLDSLLKVLPTLNEDTLKVKTLVKICNIIVFGEPKKSLQYGLQSLALAERLNWKRGIALSYAVIGDAYENQTNNQKALEYRLIELKKWQELDAKTKICGVLGNIGLSYSNLGNNLKALEYYINALKIAEQVDNKKVIVNTSINIAVVYFEQINFKKANEYYEKALRIAEQNNFENAIAIIKNNLGLIFVEENQYTKAIGNYNVALNISEKLNRKMHIAYILGDIGHAYAYRADSCLLRGRDCSQDYSKAMEYFAKAMKVAEELELQGLIAGIEGHMGNTLRKQKKFKESEGHLLHSIQFAIKLNEVSVIKEDYNWLYELYKAMNKPLQALYYHERYIQLKDSISNKDNKKSLTELQVKYETEKKETENKALAQQNRILELSVINNKYLTIVLITVLIFILSISILIIRQNKLKSKQENIRLEQKLLRTQMNPHFIFNSLTGIESFIYEHQPKEAGNYLAQFARLMRLILENSASEYISLDKELETLNYYLSLQKLRLNDNLQYSIEVDPLIKPEQVFIPPMLAQPFIENSIEHGFRGIKECGKVKVTFKLESNYLEIKIVDNGIGIVQAQQQKDLYKENKSMAMQITYERLKSLNKSKKQKLIFNVREISEENEKKGTEIIFTIPI